jgi:hypothetical protein
MSWDGWDEYARDSTTTVWRRKVVGGWLYQVDFTDCCGDMVDQVLSFVPGDHPPTGRNPPARKRVTRRVKTAERS